MNAVVRGDVNAIRIGANSNVQDCAVLHGMRYVYPVIIGDWVTIGHNATVHGCTVEDACLIGMGCTILNNCAHRRGLHHRGGRGHAGRHGRFRRTRWWPACRARSAARWARRIAR